MKNIRPFTIVLFSTLFIGIAGVSTARAAGDEWKPIDPAELALKAPKVEADADAEAIFWEVYMADSPDGERIRTKLDHYIRIKIFNERGKESQGKVDLIILPGTDISDIAGRTINANGSITLLKKEDVYERTIVKAGGKKLKAKSFALPGVEVGSIIEYRWREYRNTTYYNDVWLQRDIPAQRVKYYIKPFGGPYFPYGMRVQTFHGQGAKFVKEKEGFYSTTLTDVPAFVEEPRMPPEDEVRSWMLVYYTEDKKLDPTQFWMEYGKSEYEKRKSALKVNDDIRRKAAEIIGDAATPEQKLERLFDFCRFKIKNKYDDASGMTSEEREKIKENKSPADTLKRGMGTGYDIDMLFASLAIAAGFDARYAKLSDRGDVFFDPDFPDDYFLRSYDIAVRVGTEWKFYDPATVYVPQGMLRWQEEGVKALITDPKEPVWVQTPMSGPGKSVERRTAKFLLAEDGTLEGDVRIEYHGHLGADKKEYNDDDSPAEREETLRTMVKSRINTAELTDIRIENVSDPIKPFVYQYHIRIPGYAQRTGKRLFLQPAYFEHGKAALFPTSSRRHNVYFHYPWTEEDEVTFTLPAGFVLDSAESPAPFSATKISEYKVTIGVSKDQQTLVYKRSFFFGGNDGILFPVTTYELLRGYFDSVYKADNHTITLKQAAATAQTSPN